ARMVDRAAATAQARRVVERRYREWAVAVAVGEVPAAPVLDLPLHPPTEADALADPDAAAAWVRQWRAHDLGLQWDRRRWASAGTQDLPIRVRLDDPFTLARFVGVVPTWRISVERATALLALAGGGSAPEATEAARDAVRRALGGVVGLDETDFARLLGVLAFLGENPESGLYVRQLPIRGVDTKWIGAHRGVVTALHRAFTGRPGLGLAAMPDGVRVRFLDPALAPAGITDVTAPIAEWNRVEIRPGVVLVVENLETVVALPPLEGVMVVHGSGYAVVRLEQISWLRSARILYWGDLDSHGFAILHRIRSHLPQAESVLMDGATLVANRDLWAAEPTPFRGDLPLLTTAEASALARLRAEGDVRLEQERIEFASAVAALRIAAGIPWPRQVTREARPSRPCW
ncbi:MAG: Wadjet anti-phage system protein JetD domain-containing protein, partial [Actinomycetota bacterium]